MSAIASLMLKKQFMNMLYSNFFCDLIRHETYSIEYLENWKILQDFNYSLTYEKMNFSHQFFKRMNKQPCLSKVTVSVNMKVKLCVAIVLKISFRFFQRDTNYSFTYLVPIIILGFLLYRYDYYLIIFRFSSLYIFRESI